MDALNTWCDTREFLRAKIEAAGYTVAFNLDTQSPNGIEEAALPLVLVTTLPDGHATRAETVDVYRVAVYGHGRAPLGDCMRVRDVIEGDLQTYDAPEGQYLIDHVRVVMPPGMGTRAVNDRLDFADMKIHVIHRPTR